MVKELLPVATPVPRLLRLSEALLTLLLLKLPLQLLLLRKVAKALPLPPAEEDAGRLRRLLLLALLQLLTLELPLQLWSEEAEEVELPPAPSAALLEADAQALVTAEADSVGGAVGA